MAMAVETRLELVGKRFLCVAVGEEARPEHGESGRCWRGWRAGVIRAVSHRDSRNPDLAVRERVSLSLLAHACTTGPWRQQHLVGLPLVPCASQQAGGHAPLWSSQPLSRHPLPGSLFASGSPLGVVCCPVSGAGDPGSCPCPAGSLGCCLGGGWGGHGPRWPPGRPYRRRGCEPEPLGQVGVADRTQDHSWR